MRINYQLDKCRRIYSFLSSTNDWALPGGTTVSKIEADLKKWLTGKKSPGLIILEHELSTESVQAFITAYPLMKSNGWNITSAARLAGAQPWQNAADANSPVTPANGIIVGSINSSLAPNGTSTATGTAYVEKLIVFR